MYEKHEMELVEFDKNCVFADGDESGLDQGGGNMGEEDPWA